MPIVKRHLVPLKNHSYGQQSNGRLRWRRRWLVDLMREKEISGLSGGLFNMFGNISGIVTPIAIGYIVGTTGSFNGALIYVGVHALIAVLSYLVLVGDIKRIELKPVAGQ